MARPNKYETHVAPRFEEIKDWVRNGATDREIWLKLGISEDSFYEYKKKFSEFSEFLKKGKEFVDAQVENALLERAMGGKVTLKRPFKVKHTVYENGRRVEEKEEIVLADYEEYIIPDTTAQIFWLKNRRPEQWREKPIHDDGDKEDKAISVTLSIEDLSGGQDD